MNKIREHLSWDADRTILLVRFILAVAVVVGAIWYYRAHPYNGGSEILSRLNAAATNSEPHSATVWEIITALVMGPLYFILNVAVLLLPFLGLGLFLLTLFGVMDWLDSRGSKNNRIERNGEKNSERNKILLGDSFIRAKNLYTSLDPAAQRSALKTLKAKRNRLWCHVILYIPVCCFAWHSLPYPNEDSLYSVISVFCVMFGMFFISIFSMYIVLLAIFSIFITLRVKHLSAVSGDEASDVSNVHK